MRIGINLLSFIKNEDFDIDNQTINFLKRLIEENKDVYLLCKYDLDNEDLSLYYDVYKKLFKHFDISFSDIILFSDSNLDEACKKYNIEVLLDSEKNATLDDIQVITLPTNLAEKDYLNYANVFSELAKAKLDKMQKKEERKKQILDDILNNRRGLTLTEQRIYEQYYSQELLSRKNPKLTLFDYIFNINKNFGYKKAFRYFDTSITYKQFFEEVDKYAKAFKKAGVNDGEIVTLAVSNTPESLFMVYALNKIGAVAQIVDPRLSVQRLHEYVRKANSKKFVIIDSEGSLGKVNSIINNTSIDTVISLSPYYSMPTKVAKIAKVLDYTKTIINSLKAKKYLKLEVPDHVKYYDCLEFRNSGNDYNGDLSVEYKENRDAIIVYTSGTTGKPKGIVLSNDAIIASAEQCRPVITDMQPEDSFLGMMPIFMAFGIVNGVSFPLAVGQEVILIPKWNEAQFTSMLEKNKPNHVSSVPKCWTMYADAIRKHKVKDSTYLKTPTSGAAPLPKGKHMYIDDALKSSGSSYQLNNGWGLSQYGGGVTTPINEEGTFKYQSVGVPLPGNIVGIFDPITLEEKSYDEEGEIWVSAPSAMSRYFGDEESTNNFFIQYNGRKYGRTSDLGSLDEDGILHIVGRMSDDIPTKSGTKISPSYISEAVLDIKNYAGPVFTQKQKEVISDAIFDCAVVGVIDPNNDKHEEYQVPILHIALKDGYKGVEQEIIRLLPDYIKDTIDIKHIPYGIKFWNEDDFPYTPAKKIDTNMLKSSGIPNVKVKRK